MRTDVSAQRAAFSAHNLQFRREIGQQAFSILRYISNKLHGVTSQKMLVLLTKFFFSSELERTYRMAEEHVIARLLYESIAVVRPSHQGFQPNYALVNRNRVHYPRG